MYQSFEALLLVSQLLIVKHVSIHDNRSFDERELNVNKLNPPKLKLWYSFIQAQIEINCAKKLMFT